MAKTKLRHPQVAPYSPFFQLLDLAGVVANIKYESLLAKFYETTGSTMATGSTRFSWIYIDAPVTITELIYCQRSTGVYTASGSNNMGLYSYNTANNIATLVRNTANVPDQWKSATGVRRVPLTSSYSAAPGLYLVSFRWEASATTTAPTVLAQTFDSSAVANFETFRFGFLSTTSLPATITVNSATLVGSNYWCGVN